MTLVLIRPAKWKYEEGTYWHELELEKPEYEYSFADALRIELQALVIKIQLDTVSKYLSLLKDYPYWNKLLSIERVPDNVIVIKNNLT